MEEVRHESISERGKTVSVPACSHLDSMPGAEKKANDVECIFNNKKKQTGKTPQKEDE